ncbi:MAG: hypothetical protein ACRESF_06425, partial [Pseudomonas sp.]
MATHWVFIAGASGGIIAVPVAPDTFSRRNIPFCAGVQPPHYASRRKSRSDITIAAATNMMH